MHFLITAGPTREYIDPVRFISNGSTGKMGYACAAAAVRRGHKVTLVSGPVGLAVPKKVRLVRVISSNEMANAVMGNFARCDCVIMTAAVGDYKLEKPANQKIKKTDQPLILKLQRTIDILAELGRIKEEQLLIGFAVQDRSGRRNAQRKMAEKNLDAVVLNSPASFGSERIEAQILTRRGGWENFPKISKKVLATTLVKLAEKTRK